MSGEANLRRTNDAAARMSEELIAASLQIATRLQSEFGLTDYETNLAVGNAHQRVMTTVWAQQYELDMDHFAFQLMQFVKAYPRDNPPVRRN